MRFHIRGSTFNIFLVIILKSLSNCACAGNDQNKSASINHRSGVKEDFKFDNIVLGEILNATDYVTTESDDITLNDLNVTLKEIMYGDENESEFKHTVNESEDTVVNYTLPNSSRLNYFDFDNNRFQIVGYKLMTNDDFDTESPTSSKDIWTTINDILETTSEITTTTTETILTSNLPDNISQYLEYLKEMCPKYKEIVDLDLDKMTDTWQSIYYQMPQKLSCFKIIIKKLTLKDKELYKIRYGDFNETVNWENCHLEILSKTINTRKHFLQGNGKNKGILENIIIEEHFEVFLHEESADQWMVTKNLLLMRDCDTGEIVVFGRMPLLPNWHDIADAMKDFDEEPIHGNIACDTNNFLPNITSRKFYENYEDAENFDN